MPFSICQTFFVNNINFVVNSFIKACSVEKKSIYLVKITHYKRDLEVQRFPKLQSKLDFVLTTNPLSFTATCLQWN